MFKVSQHIDGEKFFSNQITKQYMSYRTIEQFLILNIISRYCSGFRTKVLWVSCRGTETKKGEEELI